MRLCTWIAVAAFLVFAVPAHAEKVIWKYDDLPGNADELVTYSKTHPNYVHPGFVAGEAFGQIYRPKAEDYPVKILTVEFLLAQSSKAEGSKKGNFVIEFYNAQNDGPNPGGPPIWSINTEDFSMGGQIGVPVVGNTIMIYQFDWSKPENHPPLITKGNIWVMIRYKEAAKALVAEWSEKCIKEEIAGIEIGCGCQDLAAVSDTATTLKSNVMNLVWPLGSCSGGKAWKFVEELTNNEGFTMKGDFLLRLGVDGNPPPVDVDAGPAPDAGSTDAAQPEAGGVDAAQVQKPTVEVVIPNSGANDKVTAIEVLGTLFDYFATVKLGSTALQVVSIDPKGTSLKAEVPPGLKPGSYTVVVTNPSGLFGYKENGFTVTEPAAAEVAPDASVAEVAPDISVAELASETAAAAFTLNQVEPSCTEATKDTVVTLYGTGFRSGMGVRIGSTVLAGVQVEADGGKITALLPKDFAKGEYTVFVVAPEGAEKFKANALRVGGCSPIVVGPPVVADSCTAGRTGASWLAVWMLLAGLCALAMRRRLA